LRLFMWFLVVTPRCNGDGVKKVSNNALTSNQKRRYKASVVTYKIDCKERYGRYGTML